MVGTNRESPDGLQAGYCINPAYWGHGYASEGFAAFLKLFWTLENRREFKFVVGRADPGNVASTRILQKMGGVKVRVLKRVWKRLGEGGGEEERDLACWNIYRPGVEPEKIEEITESA